MHMNNNKTRMSKRIREHDSIPPRWLNCPMDSDQFIVDKFIVSKTPLDNTYDDQVPLHCRFPPSVIFDSCKIKSIKLGLWIDLTNAKENRYYNTEEIVNRQCKYFKLQCRGHLETPSEEQTETFIDLIQKFEEKHPTRKILVHCTHGFNRTGFLIVSYLVTKMKFELEQALKEFSKVRPPGIYKNDYLVELYKRFSDVKNCPSPPSLPEWNFEENMSNGETNSKRIKFNDQKKVPTFMAGVSGVTYIEDKFEIQKKVAEMCEWKRKTFPGLQPVTLDVNNITLLHEKPYNVSWKADGTRYMMLIDGEDKVYFIDRNNDVFKVQGIQFPHRQLSRQINNTLVDGEMVIDKINGETIPRYLVYDIIMFEGQEVGKTQFSTRLYCIEHEIVTPRRKAIESGIINKATEPFGIRKKEFWKVEYAGFLVSQKFIEALPHEHDGLIFQPSNEPYRGGTYKEALKWKPSSMNSIDFKLKIVKEEGVGIISQKVCQLYVGQLNTPFATMAFTKDIKDLNNKIVECKYENYQWKFMRERTDKSFPNSLITAKSVFESIMNPVTQEGLLHYLDKYRYSEKTTSSTRK